MMIRAGTGEIRGCSRLPLRQSAIRRTPAWAQHFPKIREIGSTGHVLPRLLHTGVLATRRLRFRDHQRPEKYNLTYSVSPAAPMAHLAARHPAAGLMVRLFMIQHDCGHGAFLRNRFANDWIGRVLGVLTMTPYDYWRRSHAVHHATCGDLDRRGVGDIDTLTVREYADLPWFGRLAYRAYRHPFVMFVIGPLYMFLVQQRLPVGFMTTGWRPWISTQATNIAIAGAAALLIWLIGYKAFLLVQLPIVRWRPRRRLAVLCAAPVRTHAVGAQQHVEFHDAALHGCVLLRSAAALELDHRQYRHAPHSSSVQPHSLLPAAGGACATIRTCANVGRVSLAEFRLRAPVPVGRKGQSASCPSAEVAAAKDQAGDRVIILIGARSFPDISRRSCGPGPWRSAGWSKVVVAIELCEIGRRNAAARASGAIFFIDHVEHDEALDHLHFFLCHVVESFRKCRAAPFRLPDGPPPELETASTQRIM